MIEDSNEIQNNIEEENLLNQSENNKDDILEFQIKKYENNNKTNNNNEIKILNEQNNNNIGKNNKKDYKYQKKNY